MTSSVFVGTDVSKATLDVAVQPSGTAGSVANDSAGIDALVQRVGALSATLVVLEAIGRYEALCAAAAGVFVAVVTRPARRSGAESRLR